MKNGITRIVTSNFLSFCEKYNLDIKRAIEYIFYEVRVRQGILSEHVVRNLLEDYYDMQSKLLGIEYISSRNIDKYPKSLKLSHDIASYHYNLVKRELDSAKWKSIVPEMRKLEWTGKEYSVLIPEEPSLLVQEGASLNHCVGSYVDGVLSQKTNIVFLRSNKDLEKPLVTLEVKALGEENKLTLRQAYGNSNSTPTSEQKQAIRE